jgi:hypothetical protein
MPPTLHYPDLTPPAGWTYARQGSQIRLAPPGAPHVSTPAAIIVSPLVPRHEKLPPPAELIAMAITVEEKASLQVTRRMGPFPTKTDSGLAGVYFEIWGFSAPNRPEEHRLYVLFADELCYYGINYVATTAAFGEHEATFWASARSMQPFRGRAAASPQEAGNKEAGRAGSNGSAAGSGGVPPTGFED